MTDTALAVDLDDVYALRVRVHLMRALAEAPKVNPVYSLSDKPHILAKIISTLAINSFARPFLYSAHMLRLHRKWGV